MRARPDKHESTEQICSGSNHAKQKKSYKSSVLKVHSIC
jgi:hypothetical protein